MLGALKNPAVLTGVGLTVLGVTGFLGNSGLAAYAWGAVAVGSGLFTFKHFG